DGFRGVRDGIWTIRGLLTGFSDRGLYPLPDESGLESRYGKLEWMNEKLAEVIREIPITMRPAPETNYSMNYRQEALRPNGMITTAEFESAVAASPREQYEALSKELEEVRAEFEEFEQVVIAQFGANALSFTESKLAFEECQTAVAGILRKKQPARLNPAREDIVPVDAAPFSANGGMAAGLVGDAWAEAERMARAGEIDAALSTMTALAAAEANGRVRFLRRLLLADLLMRTNRVKLAKPILEELDELVAKHDLTHWETSDVVGAVWARLVRCYQDKNSGTANASRAAEFFLKLSRLDPWQAVALGEPPERSE
ncbi:MAG: type VI secretion system domain-containing protein, partial [Acidobacteria bacterium]|nr:type VI secretion system domain-containing protein [Acidobacteriota bacterium]